MKLSGKGLNIKEITDEEIESIINSIIDEKLGYNRNYIFSSTPKYIILVRKT